MVLILNLKFDPLTLVLQFGVKKNRTVKYFVNKNKLDSSTRIKCLLKINELTFIHLNQKSLNTTIISLKFIKI